VGGVVGSITPTVGCPICTGGVPDPLDEPELRPRRLLCASDVPDELVAVTLKVYEVPRISPVTLQVRGRAPLTGVLTVQPVELGTEVT
jgi:hypothetical protein